jgi:flagellar basal-body rod protein FlgB
MFTNLSVFKTAHAMAVHAAQRQTLVAQNIANADTPGYRAKDIEAFSGTYQVARVGDGMSATRSGHLNGTVSTASYGTPFERPGDADPNENSVSIDLELVHGVEARRQHDRALAIYKSSLNVLRSSLGRF